MVRKPKPKPAGRSAGAAGPSPSRPAESSLVAQNDSAHDALHAPSIAAYHAMIHAHAVAGDLRCVALSAPRAACLCLASVKVPARPASVDEADGVERHGPSSSAGTPHYMRCIIQLNNAHAVAGGDFGSSHISCAPLLPACVPETLEHVLQL